MRVGRAVVALAAGLLVAGCGQATTAELVMDEFADAPVEVVVPADEPGYVVQLTNVGEVPHDWTVEGLPDDVPVHLAVLEGGSIPYALPALPTGRHPFHCALDGHREQGMEGTLIVR